MKKRKLAAGIAAAALVAVLSVSAVYAGNQGKSVSALWGEILKQSADEEKINTQSADDEPLYAVGKDVSITMKEYEQVKSFYKVKMTGRRRKMRIKRSSSTMHFTQRQSKTAIL